MKLEEMVERLRGVPGGHKPELPDVFPPERIAEIKKRELKRFKEAQGKKWRNWLESVSR